MFPLVSFQCFPSCHSSVMISPVSFQSFPYSGSSQLEAGLPTRLSSTTRLGSEGLEQLIDAWGLEATPGSGLKWRARGIQGITGLSEYDVKTLAHEVDRRRVSRCGADCPAVWVGVTPWRLRMPSRCDCTIPTEPLHARHTQPLQLSTPNLCDSSPSHRFGRALPTGAAQRWAKGRSAHGSSTRQ